MFLLHTRDVLLTGCDRVGHQTSARRVHLIVGTFKGEKCIRQLSLQGKLIRYDPFRSESRLAGVLDRSPGRGCRNRRYPMGTGDVS